MFRVSRLDGGYRRMRASGAHLEPASHRVSRAHYVKPQMQGEPHAMPAEERIPVEALRAFTAAVFRAAGSQEREAALVGRHLVDANLVGHDSHGVIRIAKYLDWHAHGMVVANRHARIIRETAAHAIVDGDFGYGQVIGRDPQRRAPRSHRRVGRASR
jgi:Malate/L-lactate dehydrogenase